MQYPVTSIPWADEDALSALPDDVLLAIVKNVQHYEAAEVDYFRRLIAEVTKRWEGELEAAFWYNDLVNS